MSANSLSEGKLLADAFVKLFYNAEVQLFCTDFRPGCKDYEGEPSYFSPAQFECKNTFYITSNVHCSVGIQDFYPDIAKTVMLRSTNLGAFNRRLNDQRYTAYCSRTIVTGNPQDTHTDSAGIPFAPVATQLLKDGTLIQIRADRWNQRSASRGAPNPHAPIDILCPQALNAAFRGNMQLAVELATSAFNQWRNIRSTWQLGQIILISELLLPQYDLSELIATLWKAQDPNTHLLANNLDGSGGFSEENQNAGLLPFCVSALTNLKSTFGKFNAGSKP